MNNKLAWDGYCSCQLKGKYSWKISCAMNSSMEFNPKYVKGAPVHNLCTSTSIYTIDNMIIPKPEVTKPKEADHRQPEKAGPESMRNDYTCVVYRAVPLYALGRARFQTCARPVRDGGTPT